MLSTWQVKRRMRSGFLPAPGLGQLLICEAGTAQLLPGMPFVRVDAESGHCQCVSQRGRGENGVTGLNTGLENTLLEAHGPDVAGRCAHWHSTHLEPCDPFQL